MTHDFFGTAGPTPPTPPSSHRALRHRKRSPGARFVLGAACVIAVVVAVSWYQRGAETRHLIDSCQQSVIDTPSRYESTERIEFHGMTVIDYGDAKVVMGVMTGGPPPDNQTADAIDGVIGQTFECHVKGDGEATLRSSSYIF